MEVNLESLTETYSEGGRSSFDLSDFNPLLRTFYQLEDYQKKKDWFVECYRDHILRRLDNISRYIKPSAIRSVNLRGYDVKVVWSEGVGGRFNEMCGGNEFVAMFAVTSESPIKTDERPMSVIFEQNDDKWIKVPKKWRLVMLKYLYDPLYSLVGDQYRYVRFNNDKTDRRGALTIRSLHHQTGSWNLVTFGVTRSVFTNAEGYAPSAVAAAHKVSATLLSRDNLRSLSKMVAAELER